MNNLVINVPSEYISLGLVMQSALEQASKGKGRERHASEGEAYEDQIICEVARRVGLGYPLGQAVKKIYESQRIGGEKGVAELLGALNYIAAAVIVMREGLETAPKAEGNAKGEVRLIFKSGDPVEWNSVGSGWLPAVYEREFGDFGHCVVQMDGSERIVSKADLRRPEANCPENPDSSPEFKRGDKVEVQMTPDSSTWASATITAVCRDKDSCEWRYCVDFEDGWAHVTVPSARVRPVSGIKAEGCEELVEKDAPLCGERCEEFIPGLGTCEGCHHAREKDAPQTKEELFNRIVDCNPSTFGCVHKPTGEELAEMAEEEPHG